MFNKEEGLKKKNKLIEEFGDDFGTFVKIKREQRGMSIRGAAAEIGITAAYLSDIEKGKEKPPTQAVVNNMSAVYMVKYWERDYMMDLSAKVRKQLPLDIVLMVQENKIARTVVNMLAQAYHEFDEDKFNKAIQNIFCFTEEVLNKTYNNK